MKINFLKQNRLVNLLDGHNPEADLDRDIDRPELSAERSPLNAEQSAAETTSAAKKSAAEAVRGLKKRPSKPKGAPTQEHIDTVENFLTERQGDAEQFVRDHMKYKKGMWVEWGGDWCEKLGVQTDDINEQGKYVKALQRVIGAVEDGCLGRRSVATIINHIKGVEEYDNDEAFASAYDTFSEAMDGEVDKGAFRTLYRSIENPNAFDFSNVEAVTDKIVELYNQGYITENKLLSLQLPYKKFVKKIKLPEMTIAANMDEYDASQERVAQLESLGIPTYGMESDQGVEVADLDEEYFPWELEQELEQSIPEDFAVADAAKASDEEKQG